MVVLDIFLNKDFNVYFSPPVLIIQKLRYLGYTITFLMSDRVKHVVTNRLVFALGLVYYSER